MEFIEGLPLEELLVNPSLSLDERLAIGGRSFAPWPRSTPTTSSTATSRAERAGDFVARRAPDRRRLRRAVRRDGGRRALDDDGGPAAGVASPLYSAPERFKIAADGCGKPSDVFSFGSCSTYDHGEQPFVIKPVSLKFKALGGDCDSFVFKCLEEKPEARFADGAAALAEYRRIFRPALAPGEYRAECPECRSAQSIPGGWAGERFNCRGCSRRLEVLFYDDRSRYATTALLSAAEAALLPTSRSRRADGGPVAQFCPSAAAR